MKWLVSLIILLSPSLVFAASMGVMPALTVTNNAAGGETYSVTLQILIAMTVLTLLPAFVLMLTSFTRIIIVLGILRQAIGMPSTPTNQVLIGLSLFLTIFIMTPVFNKIYANAVNPYLDKKISITQALKKAESPLRDFMLNQTRRDDLDLFAKLARKKPNEQYDNLPFTVIMPAFVTSELKTAFQIGFLLFLPFLIIDLVVASVLMSMGMMMLSPLIVSLPFKIMLFVMVDGWTLIIGSLAASFGM